MSPRHCWTRARGLPASPRARGRQVTRAAAGDGGGTPAATWPVCHSSRRVSRSTKCFQLVRPTRWRGAATSFQRLGFAWGRGGAHLQGSLDYGRQRSARAAPDSHPGPRALCSVWTEERWEPESTAGRRDHSSSQREGEKGQKEKVKSKRREKRMMEALPAPEHGLDSKEP